MQKLLLLTGLTALSYCSYAQMKATTTSGREVILLDNGKWHYADDSTAADTSSAIGVNSRAYTKDKNADYLVKSKKLNIGVYLNQKEWINAKPGKTEDGEWNFTYKGHADLAAFMVTETAQIPLESFVDIAVINAQKTDPNAEITRKEYRMVNGVKMLCLQMSVTISKMDFTMVGYYYSNANGTVQLVATSMTNQFDKSRETLERFLNGLVVL